MQNGDEQEKEMRLSILLAKTMNIKLKKQNSPVVSPILLKDFSSPSNHIRETFSRIRNLQRNKLSLK